MRRRPAANGRGPSVTPYHRPQKTDRKKLSTPIDKRRRIAALLRGSNICTLGRANHACRSPTLGVPHLKSAQVAGARDCPSGFHLTV